MRYRDLLAILALVAVGAWLMASPSPPVTVPNAASRPSVADRPLVPNIFTSQDLTECVVAPGKFLADWEGLEPGQFYLRFQLTPADTLAATTFKVEYRGPQGFQLAGLVLEDLNGGWQLYPEPEGGFRGIPEHWEFSGECLSSRSPLLTIAPPAKASPLPRRLPSGLWRVTALVEDPRKGEYRIPQYLTLISPPAEMP